MSLYQFKIQVPRKIPTDSISDSRGRKWIKADNTTVTEYMSWDTEEEIWFVWFRGQLEVPEEGEVIEFETREYVVENVYHHRRLQRAMVTFSE